MKYILERSQVSCINSLESGSVRCSEGNVGMIKRGFCMCVCGCVWVHASGLSVLLPVIAACLQLQKYTRV